MATASTTTAAGTRRRETRFSEQGAAMSAIADSTTYRKETRVPPSEQAPNQDPEGRLIAGLELALEAA